MAKTPQQPYQDLAKLESLEFRYYPQAIMATVKTNDTSYKSSSSKNFSVLARYIFGGNAKKESIAMTAPVHMSFGNEASSMSFVMPVGYDLNNLPAPLSSNINLHQSNEAYVVALRFGGYASDEKIKEKKTILLELLQKNGIAHDNKFRYLGYNAPWDFLFRRNEILVGISSETAGQFKN